MFDMKKVELEKKSWDLKKKYIHRKRKNNGPVAIFIYKLFIFVNEDKNEIILVMVKEYGSLVSRKK